MYRTGGISSINVRNENGKMYRTGGREACAHYHPAVSSNGDMLLIIG